MQSNMNDIIQNMETHASSAAASMPESEQCIASMIVDFLAASKSSKTAASRNLGFLGAFVMNPNVELEIDSRIRRLIFIRRLMCCIFVKC